MSNKDKIKVSIVVPCYNEEGNIKALYDQVNSILSAYDIEFIFVDDNSSDGTLPILQKIANSSQNVNYVSFSRNFGHQSALRAGLEYATGDCVITMDADLQHPPDLIPTLLNNWQEGYDIVYTIRKDSEHTNKFKKITAAFFYRMINALSDINISKGSADFRLLDKKIVHILITDFTEYHLFYRGMISWIGYKQIGIEYVPNKRFSGDSKYSFAKMINFAIDGITSFSIKPLKLAIIFGLLLSVLAGVYGLYVLGISIFTNQTVKGWTSILLSVLFIGGVNMILLGIIGEYIGKLFIQSKNRPYYLIKETNLKK